MKINKFLILLVLPLIIFSCQKANTIDENNMMKNFYIPSSYQNIADLQDNLREISKDEMPAVVFISTEKTVTQTYFDPFNFFFGNPGQMFPNQNNQQQRKLKETALGSGLIYQKKGNQYYIITNNHVIENADSIKVSITGNKTYTGKVIGADPSVDIAVVRINTNDKLDIARIGNSNDVRVGDFAIAVGDPFGLSGTMTFGIISALGRSNIQSDRVSLTDFIQTDAAINPGNSGGPLLNINGEVIGINTLIYSQSGGNIGIGFAIPINIAKSTADQLIKKGKVEHGYLGIYYKPLTKDDISKLGLKSIDQGVLVSQVVQKSPADKSGIKAGDVILEVNGVKLNDSNNLAIIIGNLSPGAQVEFKISRNNTIITKEVVLGTRTEKSFTENNKPEVLNQYGMELSDLSANIRAKYNIPASINGVIITGVANGSRASYAGLVEGDVIFKVNNAEIKALKDFNKAVKNNSNLNYFYIYRGNETIIVTM